MKTVAATNTTTGFSDIDSYIASFPPEIQGLLTEMRRLIRAAVPEATEKISYQMPTFYLKGNLVHFAAAKHHLGFYPSPSGITAFSDALKDYSTSKGAIQFPYDKPLPAELIAQIVAFRVHENLTLAEAKVKAKAKAKAKAKDEVKAKAKAEALTKED